MEYFVCFCCFWLGYCLCLKVGHLLRLLLFFVLFCVSALPEVNRSIAGRKVSTLAKDTPLSRTPPSPHALQLNIVSAPSHAAAAAAGFRIKTKCVVEPNHAHHPFGRGGDLVHSGNTAANEKLLPISGELSGTCSLLGGPLRESAHCIDT